MKTEIIGREYTVDDKMKTLLEKKLKRLDKLFGDDANARLVLTQQHGEYAMEFTVVDGHSIRAEAKSMNMNDNIDKLIPKITRQFRKQHTEGIAKREKKPVIRDQGTEARGR